MPFRPLRYNLPRHATLAPCPTAPIRCSRRSSVRPPSRSAPSGGSTSGPWARRSATRHRRPIVAWLMTTLTPSALMVALVQTASTAPVIAARAVRRRARRHRRPAPSDSGDAGHPAPCDDGASAPQRCSARSTPFALLAFTFLIGAGFTFYMPAQSASINDLVARADVPRAVALGAVAFNVARAVGPALAARRSPGCSSGSALLASGVLFIVMIVAHARLEDPAAPDPRDARNDAVRHRKRPPLCAALAANARRSFFTT